MAVAAPALSRRRARPAPLTSLGTRAAGLLAASFALAVCAASSLAIGSLSIPLHDVVEAFTAFNGSDAHVIVRDLRVPRTVLGLLVGGSLGAAGALMQGVTRNPLAEPGILGINAGAAFLVVLAIYLLGVSSVGAYTGFALLGAALTAVLVWTLGAGGHGGASPVKLALAGAVLCGLLVALTSAVLVFDTRTLDEYRFWIIGSIAGRDSSVVGATLPFFAAGLALALVSGRWLNALALGDDVARSLGQRVGPARAAAAVGFVLLAGASVAAAGPILFVGLVVPHLARMLVGSDYRWIVPYSIVFGGLLLLGSDVIGRIVVRPAELEVGVVAAVVGAPFFVWLVRRRKLVEA